MIKLYPIPGAPRTETAVYSRADRRPFVPPLPDLDLAQRELHDAMLGCAANAIRYRADLRSLADSEAHVLELCRTLERLDLHDATAVARVAELELEIAELRAAAQVSAVPLFTPPRTLVREDPPSWMEWDTSDTVVVDVEDP